MHFLHILDDIVTRIRILFLRISINSFNKSSWNIQCFIVKSARFILLNSIIGKNVFNVAANVKQGELRKQIHIRGGSAGYAYLNI